MSDKDGEFGFVDTSSKHPPPNIPQPYDSDDEEEEEYHEKMRHGVDESDGSSDGEPE